MLKISYFKTTHPPKIETVKNQFFQDHHTIQNIETVKNHFISRPPHQPKIETVKNQFFQDHHTTPNRNC